MWRRIEVSHLTEREKLIELIKQKQDGGSKYEGHIMHETKCSNAELADFLLENGIITLPCKLYDTIYLIVKGKAEVFEATVRRFSINHKCELIIVIEHQEDGWFKSGNYKWSSFGKWVFLNKKEAERKLRGE